ncbi:histidine kinase [Saccharomonospora sp. CUA-673]|uniref:ATP-binding protein n=1 Tax=Saccharomonospora sp. CUA-673 TaxID=1904969 RepID=UPI000959EEBB|nr:ATP-binding protein [Saccharomonospora sp. CUA-673]OLT43103.1 histidine kinase [Saccharomonospora sp. CUA-673]
MSTHTAQVDDIRLVAVPSALNCAAMFAEFSLSEWQLPMLRETTSEAVRTLVQNVLDHAQGRTGFVSVRLRLKGDCLVIEVEDDQLANAHDDAPVIEGRRTGAMPVQGRGKLVWCEIPLPPGMSATQVRLPHRGERRNLPPEAAAAAPEPPSNVDPSLADRVLVGLKNREW